MSTTETSNSGSNSGSSVQKLDALGKAIVEQYYEFLVILDFEATCEQNAKMPNQEIIEFPSVILNTKTLETLSTFREYVKPVFNPILSKFCTDLTGIQQEWVEKADIFEIVLQRHTQFLIDNGLLNPDGTIISENKFTFVTCGDWDFQQCIVKQLKLSKINVPKTSHLKKWINVKKVFKAFYQKESYGMTNMLRELHIVLEGRHHSGLDDCNNIKKIVARMISDGCLFK